MKSKVSSLKGMVLAGQKDAYRLAAVSRDEKQEEEK